MAETLIRGRDPGVSQAKGARVCVCVRVRCLCQSVRRRLSVCKRADAEASSSARRGTSRQIRPFIECQVPDGEGLKSSATWNKYGFF